MSKQYKIAITDDTKLLRCRLIVRLIEMCGAKPVLINQTLPIEKLKKNFCDIDFTPQRNIALVTHLKKTREILDSCDGIVIPGNRYDIPPSAYGISEIHPQTQNRLIKNKLNVRHETELFMAKYATSQRKIPILGICGGMQVINVALGGTLIQHIPDLKMDINHKDLSTKHLTKLKQLNWERKFKDHILSGTPKNIFPKSHKIQVKDGTKLAEIYQLVNANINLDEINELSIHHQGCLPENLAPGLKISAIAEDGIVEAAELKNHVFCLLIQFHLECNVSKIAKPAIDKLIASISSNKII